MRDLIDSPLVQESQGLWLLERQKAFAYTDSRAHERYLLRACNQAADLSSQSRELERTAVDWASEYHVSRQRANLLRLLRFDKSSVALEVGCGCGAITRYLGETFSRVVGVEGSVERARIARARTRDLTNTEIVAAPFQDLQFVRPFDIVFCIGVYEYAGKFMQNDDPYPAMLSRLASLVRPGGYLVMALENQFGLKYLNGCTEDHVGREFEGIEGYLVSGGAVRTFGRVELESAVRTHFQHVRFLYPFPDYKIPSATLSEEMLTLPGSSELIAGRPERDYRRPHRRRMNRRQTLGEIQKNGSLHLWADSFLVVARANEPIPSDLSPLGVLYSTGRRPGFGSTTVFEADADGVQVKKTPNEPVPTSWLRPRATIRRWVPGESLLVQAERAALRGDGNRTGYTAIIRRWVEFVSANADDAHRIRSFDWTLDNIRIDPVTNHLVLIDDEWESQESFTLNAVLVRGLCRFYRDVFAEPGGVRALRGDSVGWRVRRDLRAAGRVLSIGDFLAYLTLESRVSNEVYGRNTLGVWASELTFLCSYRLSRAARSVVNIGKRGVGRLRRIYWRLFL